MTAGPTVSRRVLVPFGTRPELIKLAPVVAELVRAGHEVTTVSTGQHYDPTMSSSISEELGFHPDVSLHLDVDGPGRVGAILAGASSTVSSVSPDVVLALGDTYTVPAYALASRYSRVPFVHLEAGLRSFNWKSAEEVNRRVAAACASLHFAPTTKAASFLAKEGVEQRRLFVVGNSVIDTLVLRGARPLPLAQRDLVVVTAHRATNVDDPARLRRLVNVVAGLTGLGRVVFPVHPRTAERLERHGLRPDLERTGARLTGPVPYTEMLDLIAHARLVVTDSGGLQEEASYFGVPIVVLRSSTPRWEGVDNATAVLAGLASDEQAELALLASSKFCTPSEAARVAAVPCPYGDGTASQKVAAILSDPATTELLALVEPDPVQSVPW